MNTTTQTDKPLLELSTLAPERPFITVRSKLFPEGKAYDLLAAEDLSLESQAQLAKLGKVIEKAGQHELPTPADARRVAESLNTLIAAIVPDLEPEVLDEIKDPGKLAIAQTFIAASRPQLAATEADQSDQPTSGS